MGVKTIVKHEKIERELVYLVVREPGVWRDEDILRAFTTLEKAVEYRNRYEAENSNWLHAAINKQGGRYTWFVKDGEQYMIRIRALELDADYDESVSVFYNPDAQ